MAAAPAACAVLAVSGVYGVISYSVAERTRELALRMALGGSAGQVWRMVLLHGVRLAATGVVAGVAAALALGRVLSSLLYGVEATDPATFAGAALGLGMVAVLATATPARRAARVDPIVAMRKE